MSLVAGTALKMTYVADPIMLAACVLYSVTRIDPFVSMHDVCVLRSPRIWCPSFMPAHAKGTVHGLLKPLRLCAGCCAAVVRRHAQFRLLSVVSGSRVRAYILSQRPRPAANTTYDNECSAALAGQLKGDQGGKGKGTSCSLCPLSQHCAHRSLPYWDANLVLAARTIHDASRTSEECRMCMR